MFGQNKIILGVCVGMIFLFSKNFTIATYNVEKILADKVIERSDSNGNRLIIVDGKELKDLTPKPEPVPDTVSEEDSKRGYVVYRRLASDAIFRYSTPRHEEHVSSLGSSVSLGENRHVQFAIYALQSLGRVEVSVENLIRKDGTKLSDDVLTIRPVRLGLWRNYWAPWFMEAPKLIDAPGTVTEVVKGQSQQYWIQIEIPASAEPGQYCSKIVIRPGNGKQAEIELVIEVLPFKLTEGMWWGVYYYSGFNENTPRDFADMKSHGVNSMLICPPGHVDPVLERDGDSVKVSFPQTDLAMAELKKQGFDRPVAYYPRFLSSRILQMFNRVDGKKFKAYDYYGQGAVDFKAEDYPDDLKLVLKDLFKQMVSHAKEANWPDILWYFDDEPAANDNPGHMIPLQWALLEYGLFKEVFPQEKTLCTIYNLDVFKTLSSIDVCVGELWRLDDEFVNYVYEQGSRVWAIRWLCQYNTYDFPRHFAGVGLEKRGFKGFTEWTYYSAPLYKPYDQLLSKEGCYYAYVNDKGQLLTTIPWEAVQEGINDARYIVTLRRFVEKETLSQNVKHKILSNDGQRVLRKVMGMISDSRINHSPLTEIELDHIRKLLATTITRFVNAGITLN